MTKFERWILKRIFKKQVQQGYDHDKRITELYRMIRNAAAAEFTEDNQPTMDAYLQDWFEQSKFKPKHALQRKIDLNSCGCKSGTCDRKSEFDASC